MLQHMAARMQLDLNPKIIEGVLGGGVIFFF
jgi:hypothetical protein